MIEFTLNGKKVKTDAEPDTPLLWIVRDHFGLKGSKFGCGKGLCGACTMHLNGVATRTCVLPIVAVNQQEITTIEGLQEKGLHPVQNAWIKNNVPQCGYCQTGQIMQAASLLNNTEKTSEEALVQGMNGNICRCGTYNKIKAALKEAAQEMGKI